MYLKFDLDSRPPTLEDIKLNRRWMYLRILAKALLPVIFVGALVGWKDFLLCLVPIAMVSTRKELEQLKSLLEQPKEVCDEITELARDVIARAAAQGMLASASRLKLYCDWIRHEGRPLAFGECKALIATIKTLEAELIEAQAADPTAAANPGADPNADAEDELLGKPVFGLSGN